MQRCNNSILVAYRYHFYTRIITEKDQQHGNVYLAIRTGPVRTRLRPAWQHVPSTAVFENSYSGKLGPAFGNCQAVFFRISKVAFGN